MRPRTMRPRTTLRSAIIACAMLVTGVSELIAASIEPPTMQDVNEALSESDFVSMESICREILKGDDENAQAWFYLGYALHLQGKLDEAILVHTMASRYPQTAALANYNLACAHALKGNPDKAFEALNMAAAHGMRDRAHMNADEDLASLRKDPRWGAFLAGLGGSQIQGSVASDEARSTEAEREAGWAHTALDFWVGSWDCYNTVNAQKAGSNTLEHRMGGLVIHESWSSSGVSYKGESWTVFNPVNERWEQTWVGNNNGTADMVKLSASRDDEVLGVLFEGTRYDPSQNPGPILVRMHVRPIGEGWVRQTGYHSADDGATWKTRYDLVYVPKGERFDPVKLGL